MFFCFFFAVHERLVRDRIGVVTRGVIGVAIVRGAIIRAAIIGRVGRGRAR